MKFYKVKITNFKKQKKVSIEYPPNPTSYIYKMYEDGVQEILTEKLIDIMRDIKNADIEIVDK